jgi:hypothetical protein
MVRKDVGFRNFVKALKEINPQYRTLQRGGKRPARLQKGPFEMKFLIVSRLFKASLTCSGGAIHRARNAERSATSRGSSGIARTGRTQHDDLPFLSESESPVAVELFGRKWISMSSKCCRCRHPSIRVRELPSLSCRSDRICTRPAWSSCGSKIHEDFICYPLAAARRRRRAGIHARSRRPRLPF